MPRWSRVLSTADYVAGLAAIAPRVTAMQRRLLIAQYHAANRQVTASQLAGLAGVEGGHSVVNASYGRLGRMFCDQTGEKPDVRHSGPNRGKERLWATWSSGLSGPNGFAWQMLPEVAEALEQLGWVDREKAVATVVPHSPPLADQYVAAFQAIGALTERHLQLLRVHYHSPDRRITAKRLAELAGYNSYTVANARYGRLARLVGERLDYRPDTERLGTLVTFEKRQGEWHWLMRPQVAEALESLGWVEGSGELAGRGAPSASPVARPPSTQSSYWIVKGRPAENDFSALLRPGRAGIWRTGRPPKDWRSGDRLFFWQGSPRLSVVGLGEFTGLRNEVTARGEQLFGVRYLTGPLQHPVGIATLRKDPVLGGASFLKSGPAGTVFPLSAGHGSRLFGLVAAQDASAKKVWPDLGVAPPKSGKVATVTEELLAATLPVEFQLPDEVPGGGAIYREGNVRRVEVNRYERDSQARLACIAAYGACCVVCGFSFGAFYGPDADGYIHVHHLRPLSEVGGGYVVDPVEDLRPVCPNCHAVLHLGGHCRSIEEVRAARRPAEGCGSAWDPSPRSL